jgi:hypothetical protein
MATSSFYVFNCFLGDIGKKYHDLNDDPIMMYLSNASPNVDTDTIFTDVAGISPTNPSCGYTNISGVNIQSSYSSSVGVGKLSAGIGTTQSPYIWSAHSGLGPPAYDGFGPFRYLVLFNAVASGSGSQKLIGYWDYGSSITLTDGEEFKVIFQENIFTIQTGLLEKHPELG